MQEQENRKKILILAVAIALFGTSYYYYVHKKEKAPAAAVEEQKPPEEEKVENQDKKEDKNLENEDKKLEEPDKKAKKSDLSEAFLRKIKPSSKAKLIELAFSSAGKRDPFSYRESKFSPAGACPKGIGCPVDSGGLPVPPGAEQEPRNYVEIKGFFANKVIADINGITDSLGAGESFSGIKVLNVDAKNLTTEFIINGNKVIKKMKPVNKPDKNVEIKYLFDEPGESLSLTE